MGYNFFLQLYRRISSFLQRNWAPIYRDIVPLKWAAEPLLKSISRDIVPLKCAAEPLL